MKIVLFKRKRLTVEEKSLMREKKKKYVVECMTKKYFQFSGRASDLEWISFYRLVAPFFFAIFGGLLPSIIILSSNVVCYNTLFSVPLFARVSVVCLSLLALVGLIPFASVCVRRWHDIGLSGWWLLLLVITMFGWMFYVNLYPLLDVLPFMLFFDSFFIKGEKFRNKYGDMPE
mgnify:FL=1